MKFLTKRLWLYAVVATAFIFALSPVALARQQTSQGYVATEKLKDGSLVSLGQGSSQNVEHSTVDNRGRLLGVVVNPTQTVVNFAEGQNKVQVATTGEAPLYVSDVNGVINADDPLTVSPVSGVAMRASTAGKIIGFARQNFDSTKANNIQDVELMSNDGQKKTTKVGLIQAQINVQDWVPSGTQNSAILNGLRGVVGNMAGRPVSNIQATAVVVMVLFALIASSIILYSSVSSSIHSIGRNPLSKGIIRRSLVLMVGLAIMLWIGTALAVYAILGG